MFVLSITAPAMPLSIEQVFFMFAAFCVLVAFPILFVWLRVAQWMDRRVVARGATSNEERYYNERATALRAHEQRQAAIPPAKALERVAYSADESYPTPEWDVTRKRDDASKVLELPLAERGFTLLAAPSKHGKTTAQIQLMLADIKAGACVYWLSTHSTLYNEEDQPVDLRGLAATGKLIRKRHVDEIAEVIEAVCAVELEQRKDWYDETPELLKAAPIYVLHIGEWPELYALLSRNGDKRGDKLAGYIANLLRAGRKYKIFLSLDMQDGRAKHGLDTSDLGMFWTKIIGNLDAVSWRNIGMEGRPPVVARRNWIISLFDGDKRKELKGELGIATSEQAAAIVGGRPALKPTTKAKPIEDELTPVREWLASEPDIAGREVARRIYRMRNGLAPDAAIEYLGDGDLYYVARGLLEDAKKPS